VVINKLPVPRGQEGRAPVKLWNPKPFNIFEKAVSFFALPRYGTVDPTPHMSIFFPLFFAFIVGDVGYGLVLTAIGVGMYLAFRRKGLLGDMGLITIIIGVLCIGFGFVYGEFFGIRSWFHPLVPQLARGHLAGIKSDQIIINYLLLSLALGVAQVVLGIFLGIYNSFRIRHVRHALEGIAKLGALAGTIILVGRAVEYLSPVFLYIGGGTLAGSLIAWGIIGGPMATIELTVLITNVLSYIRLMAIGMAAVAFTSVADVFGEMLGNPVLGVIVIVGIHAFNMVLHTFSPTVQSLRLHYVEFFTKFLVPGGKEYEPFRRIDKTSRTTA
jgi:V/A-type H+-transporting ATPase subunit I